MKLAGQRPCRAALVLALAWLCASDAALTVTHHGDVSFGQGQAVGGAVHDVDRHDQKDSEAVAVKVDASLEAVVSRILKRKGAKPMRHSEMTKLGLPKVNLKAAVQRLQGKIPADVASLALVGVEGKTHQAPSFSEDSLAKALAVLNGLIEKGWGELDAKVVECKEFEEKNRGTWDQVMTDLARLGETIADLSRIRSEATEQINVKESEILDASATLKKETDLYTKIHMENSREMTIRQNDMAVFQFMMEVTKCKASFVQLDGHSAKPTARICESQEGLELNFEDKKIQEELERRMTPSALQAIREVLVTVRATQATAAAGLLQQSSKNIDDDDSDDDDDAKQQTMLSSLGVNVKHAASESPEVSGDETAGVSATTISTTTTMGVPTPPVPKVEVIKRIPENAGNKKCSKGPPDCGLLNDKMSLMWGKYKDLVDELQQEMDKNAFEFQEFRTNMNEQLEVLRNSKTRFTQELNEAVANMNSAQEEMGEKEQQRMELDHKFKVYMAACKARISYILYQDICSYISVRASIMAFSTVSPPEKITDCDVSDWVPGECSVPCDDACPDPLNPYACGGWQTLNRDVVVAPNEHGYKCPILARKKKCNQVKCPVDCEMSRWSSFAKCSKACEGGVQGKTRDIIVQPKNGGLACNTVQESRPCNTGSCDRNCRLRRWSKWTPCSVSCSGGYQERFRRVSRPIRGNGRCPTDSSRWRYAKRRCNQHDCNGDEICIAQQDLILAVDGSGSLTETGFGVLKDFASTLVGKYQGEYYGQDSMQIGVVQFGNGEITADGKVAGALEVQELTRDISKVQAAVEGLQYLKGFTNMAQAFTSAEKMLLLGGRRKAQSAVLTLTDGKPSFLFQTHEKVMQLKDKHVKLFFAPITEFEGDELKLMRDWASQPWPTHIVHVPGLAPLQADKEVFAQKMIVKFCPEAMSPSAMMFEEEEIGYLLVREAGQCGAMGALLSSDVMGASDCAALAEGAGKKAFYLGIRYARGRCFGSELAVTADDIKGFRTNRAQPTCPGGDWKDNALYDFYVLEQL